MIHQPSGGAQGQATDILIQVASLDFIFVFIKNFKGRWNRKNEENFDTDLRHAQFKRKNLWRFLPSVRYDFIKIFNAYLFSSERDNFMSANQAMDFGLIDCVPSMTVPKPPMDEE